MSKKKIIEESIKTYNEKLDKKLTDQKILKKTFWNKIEHAVPEPTVFELIKKKWKYFSAIFASLVSTGFIVAQLMMPLQFATKGIDTDNTYIDELSSEQIQMFSKEDFEFIVNEALKFELDISIEKMGSYKQLFIQSLLIDKHYDIKEKLNLNSSFEGPVTVIIKID